MGVPGRPGLSAAGEPGELQRYKLRPMERHPARIGCLRDTLDIGSLVYIARGIRWCAGRGEGKVDRGIISVRKAGHRDSL